MSKIQLKSEDTVPHAIVEDGKAYVFQPKGGGRFVVSKNQPTTPKEGRGRRKEICCEEPEIEKGKEKDAKKFSEIQSVPDFLADRLKAMGLLSAWKLKEVGKAVDETELRLREANAEHAKKLEEIEAAKKELAALQAEKVKFQAKG